MARRNTRNGNHLNHDFDDDVEHDQDERQKRYYLRQKEKQQKEQQSNIQSKASIYWFSLLLLGYGFYN